MSESNRDDQDAFAKFGEPDQQTVDAAMAVVYASLRGQTEADVPRVDDSASPREEIALALRQLGEARAAVREAAYEFADALARHFLAGNSKDVPYEVIVALQELNEDNAKAESELGSTVDGLISDTVLPAMQQMLVELAKTLLETKA